MTKMARTRLSRISCSATTTFSSERTLIVATGCGFCAKHVWTLVMFFIEMICNLRNFGIPRGLSQMPFHELDQIAMVSLILL
jgi:hypothetical protein